MGPECRNTKPANTTIESDGPKRRNAAADIRVKPTSKLGKQKIHHQNKSHRFWVHAQTMARARTNALAHTSLEVFLLFSRMPSNLVTGHSSLQRPTDNPDSLHQHIRSYKRDRIGRIKSKKSLFFRKSRERDPINRQSMIHG